jgi:hypothetical protein
MLPGPTLIYCCPSCDGLFSRGSLASGNTFGATYRSDGKMNARMLPTTPPLVACPACHKPFLMLGATPIDEFDRYSFGRSSFSEPKSKTTEELAEQQAIQDKKQKYKEVEGYLVVSARQCTEYVSSIPLGESEFALRMYAWQRANDERIAGGYRAFTPAEVLNLQGLLKIVTTNTDSERVLRAEILRELGRFHDASEALTGVCDDEMASWAEQVMRAIERQDADPFIYAPKQDDGDINFEWAWKTRKATAVKSNLSNPEPMNPPLFEISNRDWWVKVLGMCSHNWALLEQKKNGMVEAYFFHDLGEMRRGTGHSRRQLKGRCAVVDSIDFESMEHAVREMRHNGFNRLVDYPGPWIGYEPDGDFFDARTAEDGIYSREGRWQYLD